MALAACTSKNQPWLGQAQSLGDTEEEEVRAKVSEGFRAALPSVGHRHFLLSRWCSWANERWPMWQRVNTPSPEACRTLAYLGDASAASPSSSCERWRAELPPEWPGWLGSRWWTASSHHPPPLEQTWWEGWYLLEWRGVSEVPYEQGLGRVPWVRLPLNLSYRPCSHSDLHFLAQSPNPLPLFSPISGHIRTAMNSHIVFTLH